MSNIGLWQMELHELKTGACPTCWSETDFAGVLARAREAKTQIETHKLRIRPPASATSEQLEELVGLGVENTLPRPG